MMSTCVGAGDAGAGTGMAARARARSPWSLEGPGLAVVAAERTSIELLLLLLPPADDDEQDPGDGDGLDTAAAGGSALELDDDDSPSIHSATADSVDDEGTLRLTETRNRNNRRGGAARVTGSEVERARSCDFPPRAPTFSRSRSYHSALLCSVKISCQRLNFCFMLGSTIFDVVARASGHRTGSPRAHGRHPTSRPALDKTTNFILAFPTP